MAKHRKKDDEKSEEELDQESIDRTVQKSKDALAEELDKED